MVRHSSLASSTAEGKAADAAKAQFTHGEGDHLARAGGRTQRPRQHAQPARSRKIFDLEGQ